MWLERFSNHPTPSASPPPGRSSFQTSRRPSHLGLGPAPRQGGFSPRSSSLNVSAKFNSSTSSLNSPRLLANGSALRQEIVASPDVSDPLAILEDIVGKKRRDEGHSDDGDEGADVDAQKPDQLIGEIDFKGNSLQDFVYQDVEQPRPPSIPFQTVQEFEKDKDKFEDLHRSIMACACDDVLNSVEISLNNFQNDLGAVSAEIESLQNRSVTLNTKLENRKVVEKLLGPAVEEIAIAPSTVKKISEGLMDQEWVEALKVLQRRSRAVDSKVKEAGSLNAVSDVRPLLDDLTSLAIERIRDFLVSQIKSLRSPNINAQIIQQRGFLAFRDLYAFLTTQHPKLADEIGQAYVNTMRWYYSAQFARYKQALEKMPLYAIDKSDSLGADPNSRSTTVQHAPAPLSIARRIDIVIRPSDSALPSHVAEDSKNNAYLETPFHAFSIALVENASFEYAFLSAFFNNLPVAQLNAQFNNIFSPTFAIGESLTKQLIDNTYDCLGILLCVRIIQHLAFELQRRKCPVVDGYINGTNMLLWPRFQIAMDSHVESVKRATATLPTSSARATLSLSSNKDSSSGRGSTAPHVLTQKFGQFLQSILALVSVTDSSSSPDSAQRPHSRSPSISSTVSTAAATTDTTTPTSRSLDRLRVEFEAFLEKVAKPLSPPARKERFLTNNYGLLLTIIGDTGGAKGLAGEMKRHFESMGGDGVVGA